MSPFDNTSSMAPHSGNEIFRTNKRQLAGLLFGLSICATFYPMAGVVSLIGPDGTTANTGIPLASLIAGLCVITIGLTGMTTAYLSLVHDFGHKLLTGFLLIVVQTAWIPYITDMTNIGKLAASGAAFIPADYEPSETSVRAVGAFGIMGVFAFGAGFLGSLSFMSFALYAYQVGQPGARTAAYYRGRLVTYSFLMIVAGLAQLLLGVLVLSDIGSGPVVPPVEVAMFTATFPEISIFVGIVYLLNGVFGVYRSVSRPSVDNHLFQKSVAFQYLVCTVVLMILTQIAYLPADVAAAAAPSRACLTLGMHVLPACLDYKARSTPENVSASYFGLGSDDNKEAVMGGGTNESLTLENKDIVMSTDLENVDGAKDIIEPEMFA